MPDDQIMRTPGETIEGWEDRDVRTCQDKQRCEPTTFSELYVSVEPVANHDRAFGVKINPTNDRTHKNKGSISICRTTRPELREADRLRRFAGRTWL
jgi:hypothetical protein